MECALVSTLPEGSGYSTTPSWPWRPIVFEGKYLNSISGTFLIASLGIVRHVPYRKSVPALRSKFDAVDVFQDFRDEGRQHGFPNYKTGTNN
jgi:hypothetical protein